MVRKLFPFPRFQLPHQSAHHGDLTPGPRPFPLLALVLIEERFYGGEPSDARLLRHSTPVPRFLVALQKTVPRRDAVHLVQALADSRVQVIVSIDDHRIQRSPRFSTLVPRLPSFLLLHLGTLPRRFLLARHSHDFVYVFRYGFRWRWRIGGMIYVYRLMHCHVHESSARRSVAIDRSVVLRLAFVHRTLLLIGVDGRSWIVIGRFGDNWLVLLLVVHLFVIELYICFYFISWLFVVSTLLKIDDTIFCKESGEGGIIFKMFIEQKLQWFFTIAYFYIRAFEPNFREKKKKKKKRIISYILKKRIYAENIFSIRRKFGQTWKSSFKTDQLFIFIFLSSLRNLDEERRNFSDWNGIVQRTLERFGHPFWPKNLMRCKDIYKSSQMFLHLTYNYRRISVRLNFFALSSSRITSHSTFHIYSYWFYFYSQFIFFI